MKREIEKGKVYSNICPECWNTFPNGCGKHKSNIKSPSDDTDRIKCPQCDSLCNTEVKED